MTVGEKIQEYRKNLGMSQDELGQKLFVSRQTVSLWEKGQTVPTIDNLLRLKEVFGVTVDEILGSDSIIDKQEQTPNEQYTFSFSKDELDDLYQIQMSGFYKNTAIISSFLILAAVSAFSSGLNFYSGFIIGIILLLFLLSIRSIIVNRNAWKKTASNMCISEYEYKVFDDHLLISIFRSNEKLRESKCYIKNIEQIQAAGKFIFIIFGGQKFVIKKSELKDNSFFYSYMYQYPTKPLQQPNRNKWRVLSNILFTASILSLLVGVITVAFTANADNMFFKNMWIMYLFTPIPLSSIVLGFVLKSKGYKYTKNIVAGVIMTAILCIYGSFAFTF